MRTRLITILAAVAATALMAVGCGDDTSNSGDDQPASDEVVGELDLGDGEVSGVFRRTVPIADDGDGVGVLHLTLDQDCRNDLGNDVPPLLSITADDEVTLTADSDEVPFRFTGLADGIYFASGWVDDVDNPEQEEDLPATGDLVMFGDLSPRCVQFEVVDGTADPVVLELDYEMPFTLPGVEGDEGILTEEVEPVDPSTIIDDGSTHTVTVKLTRSVEPDLGGDGVGPWFAGLFPSCFDDESGATPVPDYPSLLGPVALLETDDDSVSILIRDVANGVYQLNGFIDDVTDPDGEPRPGIGDLVSFGGFGPACAQVVVDGADVTVDFDLNLVLPFDL